MTKERPPGTIQSIDRAGDILEYLAFSEDSRGLVDIARSLDLHKSTVHRILGTLILRGYVQQEPLTHKYRIGLRLMEISHAIVDQLHLQRLHGFLQDLMRSSQETVHLGILDDGEVIYVDKVESTETIRMYSRLGRRVPPHCTSLGKVLLAHMGEERLHTVITHNGLPKYTDNTITDAAKLYAHVETVRAQGYAVDDEEHEANIRCLAGPVFDSRGQIRAAFSLSGPKFRMTWEKIEYLIPLVREFSEAMSAVYGYEGNGS